MPLIPLILILIATAGALSGLLMFLNPACCIEIQKKFYEKINWRIEPISMPREVRNTRVMGLFLIIISFITAGYLIVRLSK